MFMDDSCPWNENDFFAKDNILAEYKTNDGSLWNFFCDVQKGPIKTFIPGKKSQS